MAENELQQLVINVKFNSKDATSGLKKLNTSLNTLKNKMTTDAPTIAQGFKTIEKALNSVDITKKVREFNKLANAMKTIASASKNTIQKLDSLTKKEDLTAKDLGEIGLTDKNGVEMTNDFVEQQVAKLTEVPEENSLIELKVKVDTTKADKSIADIQKQIETFNENVNKLGKDFSEDEGFNNYVDRFNPLIGLYEKENAQLETLLNDRKNIDQSDTAALQSNSTYVNNAIGGLKQVDTAMKNLNSDVKDIGTNTDNTSNSMGKFAKRMGSLVVYRLFRMAFQYLFNAAKQGLQNIAQVDDSVNEAMSNIKNSWNAVQNSLGATLGYIIEALEPAITSLCDGLTDLLNLVNEVLAAMSGQSTYKKAIKTQEDYAEALEKTKAAATGIDELNVIGDTETPVEDLYEETEIDSWAQGLGTVLGLFNKLINLLSSEGSGPQWWQEFYNFAKYGLWGEVSKYSEEIIEWWGSVCDWFSEKWTVFCDGFMKAWNKVVDWFKSVGQSISDWWSGFWQGCKNVFASFCNFFIDCWNSVVSWFENVVNTIIRGINKAFGWLGANISEVDWSGAQAEYVSFASGGFVDEGQMFIAREAGPEMVGTIGGSTAVANNDQIVEGIKQGVIEAMQESGATGGDNVEVRVYLDSQEIAAKIKTNKGGATIYKEGV